MTLADARTAILSALGRMNAAYHQTVFDEWVLVSLQPERGLILGYEGPRADSYKKTFATDVQPLRVELERQKLVVGDFAFAPAAAGPRHDAFMRIGDAGYLFCNNTTTTMAEIRKNPLWLTAQKPFVELSEKFRADPLS